MSMRGVNITLAYRSNSLLERNGEFVSYRGSGWWLICVFWFRVFWILKHERLLEAFFLFRGSDSFVLSLVRQVNIVIERGSGHNCR